MDLPNMNTDWLVRILARGYSTVLGGPGPVTPSGSAMACPRALDDLSLAEAYAFQAEVIDEVCERWNASSSGL